MYLPNSCLWSYCNDLLVHNLSSQCNTYCFPSLTYRNHISPFKLFLTDKIMHVPGLIANDSLMHIIAKKYFHFLKFFLKSVGTCSAQQTYIF